MPSPAQLAFIGVTAVATVAFVFAGVILGRVTIGPADLHEVMGGQSSRVPQIVIAGPVVVIGVTALAWLSTISLLAGAVAAIAVVMLGWVLQSSQPHADELRQRRSRLSTAVARHPASTLGLRALFVAYFATIAVAWLTINPRS